MNLNLTLLLARLWGLIFLIAGLYMLFKRQMLMTILRETIKNRTLLYIIGWIELIIGLVFVEIHNVWFGSALPIIISILGWMLLLEGLLYVFISRHFLDKIYVWLHEKKVFYVIATCYVVLGSYLAYLGFFGY
ncbi:MAG: hypothetical protein AAB645_01715 [Patescibacteria group bacterium]